ncbi:uncharacterized protein [Malus domestica]|uniref:uncharacterized protein n=1 Tax=Malus domestica TaxID=3750 RepID=UPI0039760DF1
MTDFGDWNIKISAPPSPVIEKNNDTQGQDRLAFPGNDESEHSSNHGNFLELLQFLADHNEDAKAVTLKNAPENHKLTSPDIQKDIVNACAIETIKAIIKDISTSLFSILIDESCDVSTKKQMAIVLCYVDKNGHVVERFIDIRHVTCITALSLKETTDEVFSRHKLSISRLCGQGYDGANNMQGEFNGLKALIMKESGCAYYIHCFAHQLQLALVAMAKKNIQIEYLFSMVIILVNVVGASSKRCDLLREKQSIAVIEALNSSEFTSGKGKNQETTLKRAGETSWGSHFGITNELSQALQRKDHDIVNAMKLVEFIANPIPSTKEGDESSIKGKEKTVTRKRKKTDVEKDVMEPDQRRSKTDEPPLMKPKNNSTSCTMKNCESLI